MMRRPPLRLAAPAALAAGAALLGGAVLAAGEGTTANMLSFAAWAAALLSLFALGLALPPRLARSRRAAALWNLVLVGAALAAAWLADAAVYRRDVHVDLSRERANTPPPQLEAVVDGLKAELSVTYFYNSADENALRAKALLEVAARQNERFRLRAVDLDQEPATARRFGVRAYDTAVVEAEGRRVVVENTTDTAQIAYAALRALKRRTDLVCFVAGHGESISMTPPHLHYSHVEDLKGHDAPGSGDVLVGPADGLDRLQLALTTLGYAARPVVLATLSALPQDCAMVAEVGPRQPYAPGEAALLAAYLAQGGRLLLMIDPAFAVGAELGGLLGRIGLASDPAIVVDPLNHYGADATKVAVPYYPQHPITDRVAMTVFPEARPLRLGRVPDGVRAAPLATSSADSHLRPTATEGEETGPAAPTASERHPVLLAAAFEGIWPDASLHPQKPFRMVVVGNSSFASNAYFPYVSNGELAVGMVRWLAGDEDVPAVAPQTFSPAQVDLTSRQMRDIFLLVEVALPLAVIACGGIVLWRRR